MNFGANHVLCMEVTYKTMEDNSRNTSLIKVENSSRERALLAQRLETCFLTVKWRFRFPPGRLRSCALLKSSKQKETAVSVLQPVFGFQLYWLMMNWKHIRLKSLKYSEACAIRLYQPDLWVQKEMIVTL